MFDPFSNKILNNFQRGFSGKEMVSPPDFFLGVVLTGGDCCLCAAENRGSGGRFSDRAFFGRVLMKKKIQKSLRLNSTI
jgi:hypothetical protein